MTELENTLKKINNKLQMLIITNNEYHRLIQRNKLKELEKNLQSFEERLEEIHDLKSKVQELKLENEESMEEIQNWTDKHDEVIVQYDASIEELQNRIKELKERSTEERKAEEEHNEELRIQKRYDEEKRIEEIKFEVRQSLEKKAEANIDKTFRENPKVKLPKLVISKFEGTHLDWLRFWSQFETEIDKAELITVSKLSYLKELVIPKVRALIDGLPHNSEGYQRAKTILKTKFGRPSEVTNAHIQCIISLPVINHTNPAKIHEFYEKLVTHAQALDTMGKLKEIKGYVRLTLDKLSTIRADLVRTEDDWQEWDFGQFIESLRKWTDRNPVIALEKPKLDQPRKERLYQTSQEDWKSKPCVYCNNKDHKAIYCKTVTKVEDRKKILSEKKLCFNCTGMKHRAADCRSKRTCQKCDSKHHTSICTKSNAMMVATEGSVIYPVVVVNVNNVTCRALLDTGAGSSYASSALLKKLNLQPVRKETKRIEMMMHSTTRKIDVYEVEVKDVTGSFKITTEVSKVERETLISLPNPNYETVLQQHQHLRDITMNDTDTKAELPIHMILGASEYTRIKIQEMPRIGQSGEPIAELTRLGWVVMSPGKEAALNKMMYTRSSTDDYENLYSLDVLGVADIKHDDNTVHQEFKEQLRKDKRGWYETGLIWKDNHALLSTNKAGSLARLKNLIQNLQRDDKLFERYDQVIQEQIAEGVVERVDEKMESGGKQFYLPHKAVIRENRESTKLRIVYDASARGNSQSNSLNECLETGPALQNLLWSILIRTRFKPIALCGDLQKAFLQVRIKDGDRDALRFHWIKDRDPSQIDLLRFTRLVFGLVQSPFILGATLQEHLEKYTEEYPKEVAEIKEDLYVDDLMAGGDRYEEVKSLKETAIEIFHQAGFKLHKWHSNVPNLEDKEVLADTDQTYAKQQLGVKSSETKILGLIWNKHEDRIGVEIPSEVKRLTKRTVLQKLASVYDPLGIISPTTIIGKFIYRDICESKLSWDDELPEWIIKKWNQWEKNLPKTVYVPRTINLKQETLEVIDIHVFGDASLLGTCAVAYAVIQQPSGTKQGLIASKSRLSKKQLTIPRLELVAAQMAANLAENIQNSLKTYNIRAVYGWSDSTVVLHWLQGNGSYKQFVHNRVKHIRSKSHITWNYVDTIQNPADKGSRGSQVDNLPKEWWDGPSWLAYSEKWPDRREITPTKESEKEAKMIKEVMCMTTEKSEEIVKLLETFELWKVVRVTSWIYRFSENCKHKAKQSGPLKTDETERAKQILIKHAQHQFEDTETFKDDQGRLNLQINSTGIYECRGRIQGHYPMYIPRKALLAEKLIHEVHKRTMHGGVVLTMAAVREKYWIPKLRQTVKAVLKNCFGCKRFHVKSFTPQQQGHLPTDRTTGTRPFQIIGTDFAGPIMYRRNNKGDKKAYILLFTCSLTRAIHLELLPDQTTEEFIRALKKLIARRGCPETIYSDNAKTFVAASKWIKKINKSEILHHFLNTKNIKWKFNLSRAPWWGGQFERMVGLVKNSLYKTIGKSNLKWCELEEVLTDIEITLNNRPLSYMEDDIEFPILTPNTLILGQQPIIPNEDLVDIEDKDFRKRLKYIQKCKQAAWRRWQTEYLTSLRERHNLKHNKRESEVKTGEVVVIKGDERNKAQWKIGIITEVYPGRDGKVRAVKLRAGKTYMERAIQHLYPLELSCDIQPEKTSIMNGDAEEFHPRRNAAAIARIKINDAAAEESEEPLNE